MKLFGKIFSAVLLASLLATGLISYIVIQNSVAISTSQIMNANQMISSILAQEIEAGYVESKWPLESLSKLAESKDFLFWWISDERGVIYLADKAAFMQTLTQGYFPGTMAIVKDGGLILEQSKNYGIAVRPILIGGKKWSFWFGFSLGQVAEMRSHLITLYSAIVLLAILGLGIVLFLVLQLFMRPVKDLIRGTQSIGRGHLDQRLPVHSRDELGELAFSFNQMADDLRKVTVSRDELLREIEGRQRVEASLKATQAQLFQSEKMASIGQLAAGVAHEINNPTGFVMNNLEILRQYAQGLSLIINKYTELEKALGHDGDATTALLQEIDLLREEINLSYVLSDLPLLVEESHSGTMRIKKIVADLRTFARADKGQMEEVDVRDVLDTAVRITANETKHKAQIIKEYQSVPKLFCFPQLMSQVFVNILINASQAIEKQGTITIRVSQKDTHITIEVQDTGCGMSEEVQTHLFEPFFTTKPVGQGTGLGLSLVYNIIQMHNGHIHAHSALGEGSTFIIDIPFKS